VHTAYREELEPAERAALLSWAGQGRVSVDLGVGLAAGGTTLSAIPILRRLLRNRSAQA
jgi:hypothetical protein